MAYHPITTIVDTPPVQPTTEELGFSTIITCSEEPPVEQIPGTTPVPTPGPVNTSATRTTEVAAKMRKRKGKVASAQGPYALKRRLDDTEVQKIATAPQVGTSAADSTPVSTATVTPSAPTPNSTPIPKPKTSQTTRARFLTYPSTPGAPRRSALRKDLGNVWRWMEADNKDIKRITGIRWLIKKTTLREEGKKTSSLVVYLEDTVQADWVRLGGKWLRACKYEWDRGRR
ncbi:hypothetical protein BDZ91DRAFT_761289 [Kalaharituber pfeilii]|nr:hypothetical protein BDZ91DRAFT_761289 [Kalaharituber pfeilii]